MSATPPPPVARPRIITTAFWVSVAGAVLLIAGGSLGVTIFLTTPAATAQRLHLSPQLIVGLGALFMIAGLVLGFLCGRTRNGDKRFRRAQVALSVVVVLLTFFLVANGMSSNVTIPTFLGVIPVAVGATLFVRPAASAWFDTVAEQDGPNG
jgi:hypothetical protein